MERAKEECGPRRFPARIGGRGEVMMRRLLASRHFLASLLAMGTGALLFYTRPFPEESFFLHLISLCRSECVRDFPVALQLVPFHHTVPPLSRDVFRTLCRHPEIPGAGFARPPSPVSRPKKREELFLVVGEVHDPRKPGPSQSPHWLTIPGARVVHRDRHLLGAVGSGKTATAMYPFAEQILAFKAADQDRKIGALVLEVKGDFCHKFKQILESHDRVER